MSFDFRRVTHDLSQQDTPRKCAGTLLSSVFATIARQSQAASHTAAAKQRRHGSTLTALMPILTGLMLTGFGGAAQASGTSWNNSSQIFGAAAMTADASGNVFATGIGEVSYEPPIAYIASYSKSGATRWFKNYPNFDAADPLAVAADGNGGAAIAGFTYEMTANPSGPGMIVVQIMLVVKFDTLGNQTWAKTFVGTNLDGSDASAKAVTIDTLGNVYVTGNLTNNTTGDDIYTLKLASATGNTVWAKTWNDAASGNDLAGAIALDGSGNVYVGGAGGGSGVLLKYSTASGALAWSSAVAPPGGVSSIAPSGAYVYVAGANARQFLASNGTQVWATPTYGGMTKVAVDNAGDVFTVGSSTFPIGGPPTGGVVAFRLSPANGSVLWQKAYPNASPPQNGIAVDGGGTIYVTGSSPSSSPTTLVALKYNTAGTQLDFYSTPAYLSSTTDIGVASDGAGDAFLVGLTPTSTTTNTSSVLAVGLLGF